MVAKALEIFTDVTGHFDLISLTAAWWCGNSGDYIDMTVPWCSLCQC